MAKPDDPELDKLYVDVQMMLAGHPSERVAKVTANALANVLGFMAADRSEAERLCDDITRDLKAIIRNNWSVIREARHRSGLATDRGPSA